MASPADFAVDRHLFLLLFRRNYTDSAVEIFDDKRDLFRCFEL